MMLWSMGLQLEVMYRISLMCTAVSWVYACRYCNTMRTHGAILVGSTIRLASLVSRTLLKMGRVARTSWALFKRFGARGNVLMLL
jgi:hypothetical protein